MDIEKRITEAFLGHGERRTEPRRIIAKNLIGLGRSGSAFSAEDLLKRLRRTNPRIGRATVYRSIEKLARMKVLDRIEFADGTHSFRLCENEHHHHHLACTKCHRVVELDFCLESGRIAAIGKQQSFEVDDHAITLFGLCKACQALRAQRRGRPAAL
jgi:Fur family transcriptional regulator, ferric uptake regulator